MAHRSIEAERERIQAIIDRHASDRPEIVQRVQFHFSEDHAGNSALNIEMIVSKDLRPTPEEIEDLTDFAQILINDVLDEDVEYWPYIRTLVE